MKSTLFLPIFSAYSEGFYFHPTEKLGRAWQGVTRTLFGVRVAIVEINHKISFISISWVAFPSDSHHPFNLMNNI